MRAIILAAGRGSRMKALTEDCPKCLIEFKGKSLLEWQLAALHSAGIDDIALVTGYKRELLQHRGCREFHNSRWNETNMVSSLACASSWLEESPCIVSYSDIYYDSSAVDSLIEVDAPLAVTYDPDWLVLWEKRFGDPLIDAETFRLNLDGTLAEIGQKPATTAEIQGQYMGLLRFTPIGWSEIQNARKQLSEHDRNSLHMTGALQHVLDSKRIPIAAVPYHGEWGEFDSPDDLKYVNNEK